MMIVYFNLEPFCEHCGILHPPAATFMDDDIEWCPDCAYSNALISEEECDEAYRQQKILNRKRVDIKAILNDPEKKKELIDKVVETSRFFK